MRSSSGVAASALSARLVCSARLILCEADASSIMKRMNGACTSVQVYRVHMLADFDFAAAIQAMVPGQTMHRHTSGRVFKTMVGRDEILRAVQSSVKALALHNSGSLIMIAGDAGHGKSKLLTHLAKSEEFEGYRSEFHIFRASGTPERQPVPLTPWRSILLVRS